jgi:hypothetical protein
MLSMTSVAFAPPQTYLISLSHHLIMPLVSLHKNHDVPTRPGRSRQPDEFSEPLPVRDYIRMPPGARRW